MTAEQDCTKEFPTSSNTSTRECPSAGQGGRLETSQENVAKHPLSKLAKSEWMIAAGAGWVLWKRKISKDVESSRCRITAGMDQRGREDKGVLFKV